MRRDAFVFAALLVFAAGVPESHAQTLAQRVDAVRDGIVLMAFQAVSPAEAAHYLPGIAHSIGGRSGSDAVSAAALSDAPDTSPDLVSLVRDANAPLDARKQALFWAGNTSLATRELVDLYDGLAPFSLREHFVFVISQRRDDAAVDKLIDVARRDANLEIRKRAMYWLGQTQDPRAVKFLRDLVTR
jgi:hypothetical protein